jgi:hypothetical protein
VRHELWCLFLALARCARGGGGGESEDEVTEMTSRGSGSQLLLRRGGGEDSEGEGRKRGVLDVRRGGQGNAQMRIVGRRPGGSVTWRMHTG